MPPVEQPSTSYGGQGGGEQANGNGHGNYVARRRQSKRGEVKCQYCNKIFNNPSNLQRHIRHLHGDVFEGQLVRYSCHICHRYFDEKSQLLQHFKDDHEQSTTYYETVSALSNHLQVWTRNLNTDAVPNDTKFIWHLLCDENHYQEVKSVLNRYLLTHAAFRCSMILVGVFRRVNGPDSTPERIPLR